MNKSILIVADPLEKLSFASDSSLAMAQGALSLGYRVCWTTAENVGLLNGTPVISELTELAAVQTHDAPVLKSIKRGSDLTPTSDFSKVLIRKDPPFDSSYTDLCWILSQCSREQVINDPRSLLTFHEKLTPWHLLNKGLIASHQMVPTLVSKNPRDLTSFARSQFEMVDNFLAPFRNLEEFKGFSFKILCKPWRGHAGRGVHTFASATEFEKWLNQQQPSPAGDPFLAEHCMLQPLLPEIHSHGDRRVFIVNGKIEFDFVRRPATGRIEANLAQGGHASLEDMSEEVLVTSERIAKYLQENGILVAGLDFIGQRLTEVNVTSPTGIRTFEKLSSKSITTALMQNLLNHSSGA